MRARAARAAGYVKERWARIAGIAIVLAVFFGNGGFRSLARNWFELRKLDKEISTLEREQLDLEGKLKAMRSGDGPVERLARRELGYIKKGEIEYRFPPPTKK